MKKYHHMLQPQTLQKELQQSGLAKASFWVTVSDSRKPAASCRVWKVQGVIGCLEALGLSVVRF